MLRRSFIAPQFRGIKTGRNTPWEGRMTAVTALKHVGPLLRAGFVRAPAAEPPDQRREPVWQPGSVEWAAARAKF
jgi:hypothetical protein